MERSSSEKRAYVAAMRQERDETLDMIGEAWAKLDSAPDDSSQLLTQDSYPPRIYALLAKGRAFLDLSREVGRSAASQRVRNQYKKKRKRPNRRLRRFPRRRFTLQ